MPETSTITSRPKVKDSFSRKLVCCLILALFIGSFNFAQRAWAGKNSPASMYQKARESYFRLDKSAERQKYRHNWLNTIDLYRLVFETNPKSREADDAMYMVGKLYRSLHKKSLVDSDLDMSVYYFRRLVKSYPESRYADDAQYFIGEIFLDEKKEKALAYREFEKVVDSFPDGDMYKRAAAMVSSLSAYSRPVEPEIPEPPPPVAPGKLAQVTRVRHWSNPNYTRVVVDIDHQVKYNYNFLKQAPGSSRPPRLYIDLFNARLSSGLQEPIPISDGLLTAARAAQFTTDTVRVVLDMTHVNNYKIFAIPEPFRIVIDVIGDGREKIQVFREDDEAPAPARDPRLTLAQQLSLGVNKVVIDPGHGGKDPGAVGVGNLQEKDITLDIALRLKKILHETYGLDVIMTRETDVFIELPERTAFANASKADLFVSIHCNSSRRNNLRGVETYFLNLASSKEAMETAAIENMASVARIADFEKIMVDFMVSMKIDESSRLARIIQDEVVANLKSKYRDTVDLGVKQAPFFVLIGATMPSILAEISFINHPIEGKRLALPAYRHNIAEALAAGIGKYINSVKLVSSQ